MPDNVPEVSPVDEGRFQNLRPKPPQAARGEWTQIVAILDRSGSMKPLQKTSIDGFNKFLADQQKEPGWATLSLILFNTTYDVMYDAVPLKDVRPLDTSSYVPDGGTALLDAVGKAITDTKQGIESMAKEDRPAKVLFVILTDGEENSSTQYNLSQVQTMLKAQQECGWPFLYLAASAEAFSAGAVLGIDPNTRFQYKGTDLGTQMAYMASSNVASVLRSSNLKGVSSQVFVADMADKVRGMLDEDDNLVALDEDDNLVAPLTPLVVPPTPAVKRPLDMDLLKRAVKMMKGKK